MRAAAILAPNITANDVAAFRRCGGLISVENTVPADAEAALIFGGDGTVHRHLAGLAQRQIPVLVVPAGSGNDFARSLGLRTPGQALAAWRRFLQGGSARPVDVGVVISAAGTCTHFCSVLSVGFGAEGNRRANAMPRWLRARGGYILGALLALPGYRASGMGVLAEQDGRPPLQVQGAVLAALVSNTPSYGDGMIIAPAARLDDGLLEVVVVRDTAKWRVLRHFHKLYSGRHVGLPEVEHGAATRVRIEAERPLEVYADGEFVCRTPVEIQVARGMLRVIA